MCFVFLNLLLLSSLLLTFTSSLSIYLSSSLFVSPPPPLSLSLSPYLSISLSLSPSLSLSLHFGVNRKASSCGMNESSLYYYTVLASQLNCISTACVSGCGMGWPYISCTYRLFCVDGFNTKLFKNP